MAFAVEGKVPVEVAIVTVFLKELSTLNGSIKPFLTRLHSVVELGEHPHFAALHPNELIGIVNRAVAIKAGEIAAKLLILGLVEPERNHAVKKLRAIQLISLRSQAAAR